jgi:opacity protein-like surface antigen
MGSIRRFTLTALVAMVIPAMSANAGGLQYPSPPAPPAYPVYKGADVFGPTAVPAPAPIPEVVEWYFRGDFSLTFFEEPSASDGISDYHQEDMPDTWGGGGGLGYYFGEHVRGDLTLDYNTDTTFRGVQAATDSTHDVSIASLVGLANLYYDILPREHITPYIGGGIGFAHHETEKREITFACPCPPHGTETPGSSNNFDFAAGLMAGVSWTFHEGFLLDAGYRYLYMGEASTDHSTDGVWPDLEIGDIQAHQFRIGLRYELY